VSEPFLIPVEDLRRVAERLLDHVRSAEGDVVELHEDMFWSIPPDALYDVYQQPPELTIGQLTESWDNLGKLMHDGEQPAGLDLVWLSDVLRAIGHAQLSGS
jgi:hypothetical protein